MIYLIKILSKTTVHTLGVSIAPCCKSLGHFMGVILLSIIALPDAGFSQQELLPKGIGAFRLGYRPFFEQSKRYAEDGSLEPLAKPLNIRLRGSDIMSNMSSGSSDNGLLDIFDKLSDISILQPITNTIANYVNGLDIGELQGDVRANVTAKYLGLGFAFTNNISLQLALTFIDADVTTNVKFRPGSSLAELRNKYPALAASIDTMVNNAPALVKSTIESKGFEPLDSWNYSGMGDTRLGLVAGRESKLKNRMDSLQSLNFFLSIPTGHVDDPNILNDVNLERGYYYLSAQASQKFVRPNKYWLGIQGLYGYSFKRDIEKRVPEYNEPLTDKSRQATVTWNPGNEYDISAQAGLMFMSGLFKPMYRIGMKRHFEDSYSGSLIGNYDILSRDSDMTQIYNEISVSFDTLSLYNSKQFKIPMMVNLTAYFPISAKNSQQERYIELSLQSFFPTPMANIDILTGNKIKKDTNSRKKTRTKVASSQKKKVKKPSSDSDFTYPYELDDFSNEHDPLYIDSPASYYSWGD